MESSFSVDFITNTDRPNGGVSRPISTARTVTIPNQIRSIFIGWRTGSIKGTRISMMEDESSIVPMAITSRT